MQDPDENTPIATEDGQKVATVLTVLRDELARAHGHLESLANGCERLGEDGLVELLEKLEPILRNVGGLGHDSARVFWNVRHAIIRRRRRHGN